jgi:regulatory protein
MQEENRKKKVYAPEQALQKARDYCVYQERCHQEVRDKLYGWGLYPDAVENCISALIAEGFLNEERFAKAYAGGKFRLKGWGKIKIRQALKHKKISEYCIRKGLQEITPEEYEHMLEKLISRLETESREKDPLKKKYKIAQSLLYRGFEQDLIWNVLNKG